MIDLVDVKAMPSRFWLFFAIFMLPVFVQAFRSLITKKDLKLGQYLDIDDTKFCKVADLRDIDQKFSGLLSDIDISIDKLGKFHEVSMSKIAFQKLGAFQILIYNSQTRRFT